MEKMKFARLLALAAAIAFMFIIGTTVPGSVKFFDKTPPTIDIWYGDHQVFGKNGLSQRWVNVLGNIIDPESQITSLTYRLNGGAPITMRMGPDQRRLEKPGDFNVEISPADLRTGDNQVIIEASNRAGLTNSTTVRLEFYRSSVTLPYTIDWSKVSSAQEVLQIVDGKWTWDASGIRPVEMGYDRFLTVGDYQWTNYVVTVPITVHGLDKIAFERKNGGQHAGISLDMRWVGHSDIPVKCPPPHCGWDPSGNYNKYWFMEDGKNYLGLKVLEKEKDFPTMLYNFNIGDTYIFKTRVETTPEGNLYSMKVWKQGAEKEPAGWLFQRLAPRNQGPIADPGHGAFSLVAHHSDVTFGNILVEPLP